MKKIIFPLLLLLAVGVFVFSGNSRAAGPAALAFEFSASAASAPADGQAAITVSVHTYEYKCSDPDSYGTYHYTVDPNSCAADGYGTAVKQDASQSGLSVAVSGGGNTVSPAAFDTDSSGHASFTVKSTLAGTKTVTIFGYGGNYEYAHTTVTFTSPAPAASTPTPVSKKPAAPAVPASEVTPPAAPSLASIQTDAQQLDAAKPITLTQSKPLVLAGTTVPNGVVTLTIHSTPKTATVTADKDGRWSYTISGLEAGDHYVEAAVTDPATHKTSGTAKLIAFTLTAAPKTTTKATATAASPKKQSYTALIIGLLTLVLLGSGGWFLWRWRRKKHSGPNEQQPTISNPSL